MHITISARPTKSAIIYEVVIRAATKAECESLHFHKLLLKNAACKYQPKIMFHVKHQNEAQTSCKKRADKRVVARQLSKFRRPKRVSFQKTKM